MAQRTTPKKKRPKPIYLLPVSRIPEVIAEGVDDLEYKSYERTEPDMRRLVNRRVAGSHRLGS